MIKKHMPTTHIIILGFAGLILLGTLLLHLPISARDGQATPWLDALFTADTSSCVTGLVVLNTWEHWNWFGQLVMLLLIQIGGLGVVTIVSMFMIIYGRHISIRQRLLLQDAFNLSSMQGIVQLTLKVVRFSLIMEGIGALLYAFCFVPQYGFFRGIWHSVFTSVSAFCNAGIDLTGQDSLCQYRGNVLINFVTIGLIVISGLGFPVWWDIAEFFRKLFKEKVPLRRALRCFNLHSKLVLCTTGVLIVFGTGFILISDYTNPNSLGQLPFGEKLMCALFQSVTLRTAGFETIPQANFSYPSQLIALVLMFIGGSPCGTAGGIKTVTFAVLLLSVFSTLGEGRDTEIFHRRISDSLVRKATNVFMVSFIMLMVAIIALSAVMPETNTLDIVYELTSAIATVGLSRGLTASLTSAGKLIVIFTMFLGRVGPISMALAFHAQSHNIGGGRELPEEPITIG